MTTGRGDLERLHAFALRVHVDELSRLHAEGGAVDSLAVYQDVAVHDHLASLRRGARNGRSDDEGVEAHLQLLDQVLTGQTSSPTGLFELDLELGLADAVLGT